MLDGARTTGPWTRSRSCSASTPGEWRPIDGRYGGSIPTAWVANVTPFLIETPEEVPLGGPERADERGLRRGLQRGEGRSAR